MVFGRPARTNGFLFLFLFLFVPVSSSEVYNGGQEVLFINLVLAGLGGLWTAVRSPRAYATTPIAVEKERKATQNASTGTAGLWDSVLMGRGCSGVRQDTLEE